MSLSSCGGGGGGGSTGVTVDNQGPLITFVSPAESSSLSYEANPDSLPSNITISFSDVSGIDTSSFSYVFDFQNVVFNLSDLFTVNSNSAVTNETISPLYWTVISKYSMNNSSKVDEIKVFGVSSGSSGILNLIDFVESQNIIVFACTSRNYLIYVDAATGNTVDETPLNWQPSIIGAYPDSNRLVVAYDGSNTISIVNTQNGSIEQNIVLAGEPFTLALNKNTGTAYITYQDSTQVTMIDMSDLTVQSDNFQVQPVRTAVDNQPTGRLFYAGGSGPTRGIYQYSSGGEMLLFTISEVPESISFESDSQRLFLADYAKDSVSVYNALTGQFVIGLSVGQNPFSLISSNEYYTYSMNKGNDSITVINSSSGSIQTTINLDFTPVGFIDDSTGGYLYVLENIWDISSTETGTITATVEDSSDNLSSKSVDISITPVSSGGPGSEPSSPPE